MVALYFRFYNFNRAYQTLRVTPAMEAEIADHVWSIDEIVGLLGRKDMRFAALLVAVFTIIVGIVGLISPDSGTRLDGSTSRLQPPY